MTDHIITAGGVTLAIILKQDSDGRRSRPGSRWLTAKDAPLQFAEHVWPPSTKIMPHRHNIHFRRIYATHETLYVVEGYIVVSLYDVHGEFVHSSEIHAGEAVLLCGGGHSIWAPIRAVVVETKQGPYLDRSVDKEEL